MSYYRLLNLSMEPFSNSPDPEFFFQSRQHMDCLQKLEISVRLRRGLNVVIGEVGTGKTTLCRQLIRLLADDGRLDVHLILDPHFVSPMEFLLSLARMFGLSGEIQSGNSEWTIKGMIQEHLLAKGVEQGKITLVIVDEGQKIPDFCLEILRELLNFEVNEYKLLQIVVFAQKEFERSLVRHPNFADRISLYRTLGPLPFGEMKDMIRFRLEKAANGGAIPEFLSFTGLLGMYRATGGFPRKIIHLSHRILLSLIIKNRSRAGWFLVKSCARTTFNRKRRRGGGVMSRASGFGLSGLPSELRRGRPFRNGDGDDPGSLPAVAEAAGNLDREKDWLTAPFSPESGPDLAVPMGDPPAAGIPAVADETSNPVPPPLPAPSCPAIDAPDMLGRLTVTGRDSLERMISTVYGVFTGDHLEKVIKANPHIENGNGLNVGVRIGFPALPSLQSPLPPGGLYLQVAETDDLRSAYAMVAGGKVGAMPVRLLPYRAPGGALKFSVLLKYCYIDEEMARSDLEDLSSRGLSGCRVLEGWEEGTVFLANGTMQ
jgi:general secretion pathway protein A